jgi:putative ABC transport system substrate-binding protein
LVAVLVNPTTPEGDASIPAVEASARSVQQDIVVLKASTEDELEKVFAGLPPKRVDALFVGTSAYFNTQRHRLVSLVARQRIPAIYDRREFAAAGGLISYGTNFAEAYRQLGLYAGRLLKGEKPADLPVIQSVKFELVINLKTAQSLGLTIPPTVLALADEVIE